MPHLNAFYPLYAEAIQKKGTPTAGLPYYQTVAQQFPNNLKIMAIYQGEQIIGGTFMAHFKDTLYYLWPGVPRQFYSLHPYPLLYWEMARYGCLNGLRLLDLGRSQCGSGALKFKLDWGADSQKLYQLYYLNNIDKPPPVGHSMDAQLKYQLFFAVWQRLPWALAEQIGPQLRKQMPFG